MWDALFIGFVAAAAFMTATWIVGLFVDSSSENRSQSAEPSTFLLDHPPTPSTAWGRAEFELRRYLELGEIDDEEYHRRLKALSARPPR